MSKVRFGIAWGVLLAATGPAWAAPDADKRREDARALAGRIDRHLEKAWAANKIVPAAPADDAEFLRRVYLHLAGRIPSVAEARRFLADTDPDKRIKEVERLLDGQRYPAHMASVWRALMLPEASAGGDLRFPGGPLEAWLRSRFAANVGYDRIVREVVTAGPGTRTVNPVTGKIGGIDPGDGTSPISFYQAKQFKPEEVATATARVFLGVRLGCAQCHNHPFAHWKREQFWQYAAFFASVGPQNRPDAILVRELKIPGTDKVARATFLDGKQPQWTDGTVPREALADWMTSKDNAYFARAAVNRVWSIFYGLGISEPVDEMVGTDNRPSHPELLDDLAREFADHDFDMKYLILAITSSKAYQLSSLQSHPSQDVPRQFARAPLLGMTPEQLFDSVAEATRYGSAGGRGDGNARQEFLSKFNNLSDRPTEYQTSMVQALALMNGRLTADATSLERSQLLAAVLDSPFMDTPQRIETLYLATLTRKPTEKELARAARFIDEAVREGDRALSPDEKDRRYKRALADLFWVLLNSGEFFFNH
jgi:hypothetical protein